MADDNPHRFADRDGLDLAYRETGTGRPLVLLHGFAASAGQWLEHGPAAALAAQGYRVILPDLRGHGDSARPHDPARYPPDVLADDGLTQLGGDPQALLQVLDSLVATPGEALRQVDTPALVVAGDQDHDHACAADLAAVLPRARFVPVPGDHWTALTSPELGAVISAFLGPGEDRQGCQPSR